MKATNEREFTNMITNPGPLRIGYSVDYLDWVYRAYKSKVKSFEARQAEEKKFHGCTITGEMGKLGSGLNYIRPVESVRRKAAERLKNEAQASIDQCMIKQGLLDVFERQPQFPVIHLDKADRVHVVELFKEIVLDKALQPCEIWDKALLYRAILAERRGAYPKSFGYIFEALDEINITLRSEQEGMGMGAATVTVPRETDYLYFLYLVKKYSIENAVEGHVVLRCHRMTDRNHLLFSVPPPKDEKLIKESIQKAFPTIFSSPSEEKSSKATENQLVNPPPPASYPSLQALWRCEENFPLLLVLVFGELNFIVTENPFTKFPNALPFLTRPYASAAIDENSDSRGWSASIDTTSLSNVISEKRGSLMAPLPRNVSSAIEARAMDLRRLRQRFHREDILGYQKLMSGSNQENPGNYSSYADWAYFNPRATRAEARDEIQLKALSALKQYDRAKNDIYRCGYDEAEEKRTERPVQMKHLAPTYLPSISHFLSIVQRDSHISFLMNVVLHYSKQQELEKLCFQLANALYRTSLEYHREEPRRLNRQKVQVAAVLLDNFVTEEWNKVLCRQNSTPAGPSDNFSSLVRRLGSYAPFETRALDESGFTTDARSEDYTRWMAPTKK